jgi:hypothetical protein
MVVPKNSEKLVRALYQTTYCGTLSNPGNRTNELLNRQTLRAPSTSGKLLLLRSHMEKPQSLANHTKYDPPFHFFVIPILSINVLVVGFLLLRFPGIGGAWLLLVSAALLVHAGRMRSYATHLQDRVIRLEERLRLATILQEPLRSRISELTDSQLIGLRFASDAELPALTQRALDEKLSRSDIKKAVTEWRPDYSRI